MKGVSGVASTEKSGLDSFVSQGRKGVGDILVGNAEVAFKGTKFPVDDMLNKDGVKTMFAWAKTVRKRIIGRVLAIPDNFEK